MAKQIEGGDMKGLLTEGLEEPPRIVGEDEEEEVIPIARKWSLWR